jgi:hypothetical protein
LLITTDGLMLRLGKLGSQALHQWGLGCVPV